jgi:hypothetical protein
MFFVSNLLSSSQAGRRGFASPVSRSKINNLQIPEKHTLHSPPLSITRTSFVLEHHW